MHGKMLDTWILQLTCSQIMQEDDKLWPVPDRIGRQVSHSEHIIHFQKT